MRKGGEGGRRASRHIISVKNDGIHPRASLVRTQRVATQTRRKPDRKIRGEFCFSAHAISCGEIREHAFFFFVTRIHKDIYSPLTYKCVHEFVLMTFQSPMCINEEYGYALGQKR